MSLLRPGVIEIYEGDRVAQRIFVGGGFAEVNEKGCTVLAEFPLGNGRRVLARKQRNEFADSTEYPVDNVDIPF